MSIQFYVLHDSVEGSHYSTKTVWERYSDTDPWKYPSLSGFIVMKWNVISYLFPILFIRLCNTHGTSERDIKEFGRKYSEEEVS